MFKCINPSCNIQQLSLAPVQCNVFNKKSSKFHPSKSVYNLRRTASRPAKKQTEKYFSCLNKKCSAILLGVRVRYCKDCARARYLYVLTSDRKSKTKQLVRRRRKDIISSLEYQEELAKTAQVLNQAGRSFSTVEFTTQKCSGESCNGVSLLAKPYCLDCWNADGFSI